MTQATTRHTKAGPMRDSATPASATKATRLSSKQAVAWRYLEENNQVTEILYGGAAGGGKSWLGCLWQIYRRISYPGTRGLIGRSQLINLRKTTKKTFDDLWEAYGRFNPAGVTCTFNSADNTYRFSNGSEILLKDLFQYPKDPDFHSLGSLEITDAFVDEAGEISKKAADILMSRIRYRLHLVPHSLGKMLYTSNPADGWLKYRFVLDKDNKPVEIKPYQAFVRATVQDNPDPLIRGAYDTALSRLSNYDQARLRFGDWSMVDNAGNKFYWAFERSKHVVRGLGPSGKRPLHLSFDQNVVPYITCTAWEVDMDGNNISITAVDEITLDHPRNNTTALCEEILNRYRDGQEFLLYGDASGNKRSTTTTDTDYAIVQRLLRERISIPGSLRFNRSNPPVLLRRDFINELLGGGLMPHITIRVSDRCKELVRDMMMVNEDSNGHKHKAKERDPNTRESFEKYGHASDTMDYFLTSLLNREFGAYRKT